MKSKKLWAVAVAAVAAVALTVLTPGGSDVTQAKGPDEIDVSVGVGGGGVIPGLGAPVATQVTLGIDVGNPAPSGTAFFDLTTTTSTGSETARGPLHPGGGAPAATAIGSQVGSITFSIQTNAIGTSGFVSVATSPHFGAIGQCGDNYGGAVTRSYIGAGPPPADGGAQLPAGPATFGMYVASMAGRDAVVAGSTGFLNWDGGANEALYAHSGGALIQTYDDDNDNGIPDSQEVAAGEAEPVADAAATPAHPYATGGAGTAYVTSGAPETQQDDDADIGGPNVAGNGLPSGHEFMPDFLPLLADTLGIRTNWEGRSYGVADVFVGVVAPTDVHFMGFSDLPGGVGLTFTVLANPFAPANPASAGLITCPPFSTDVALTATSSSGTLCLITPCGPPAGRTIGDPVSVISDATPGRTTTLFITDGDDFDADGIVGGVELCARSATNTDPDGDLTSGACDPFPATWDNDNDGSAATADRAPTVASLVDGTALCLTVGNLLCDNDSDNDKFINNVDNCETTANPTQADGDGDGVGDSCDVFAGGKGDGTGGFPSLQDGSATEIDNDLTCSRTWQSGGTLATAAATCTAVNDSSDDGVLDPDSTGTDEDGDGFSDAAEVNNAPPTNPLDPGSVPACLTNPTGAGGGTDSDNDHLLDSCEAASGTTVGNADTDADGVQDGVEVAAGTDPTVSGGYGGAGDTDFDGCTDTKELDADNVGGAGADRHPGSWWDFYSVDDDDTAVGYLGYNPNNNVDLSDVLDLLGHFGEGFNGGAYGSPQGQDYDRVRRISPSPPGSLAEANNGIDLSEALAGLAQFGFGGAGCAVPHWDNEDGTTGVGPVVPPTGSGQF